MHLIYTVFIKSLHCCKLHCLLYQIYSQLGPKMPERSKMLSQTIYILTCFSQPNLTFSSTSSNQAPNHPSIHSKLKICPPTLETIPK